MHLCNRGRLHLGHKHVGYRHSSFTIPLMLGSYTRCLLESSDPHVNSLVSSFQLLQGDPVYSLKHLYTFLSPPTEPGWFGAVLIQIFYILNPVYLSGHDGHLSLRAHTQYTSSLMPEIQRQKQFVVSFDQGHKERCFLSCQINVRGLRSRQDLRHSCLSLWQWGLLQCWR